MIDDVTTTALETANRARTYHRLELIVVSCTVVVLLAAALVGLFFGVRQADVKDSADRSECIARSLAVYAAESGDAFADGANVQSALHGAADRLRGDLERC